jgi:hypothetical protein
MAHKYEVHTDKGTFDVTTPHHHDDHHEDTFLKHLLDVIKGAAGGVGAGMIMRYIYKGKH